MQRLSLENKAKLACLIAGVAWGLFWIPLRGLERAGIHELWITVVYFLVPCCLIAPVVLVRWRRFLEGGTSLQITLFMSGCALSLYSASIVYTDVVRAIMLFYLMPIWSAILARMFLGEAITAIRILAMLLAALGMLVLFGLGAGVPLPRNAGDWMGLLAGFFWAVAVIRLRKRPDLHVLDLTAGFFVWGLILCTTMAVLFASNHAPSIAQTAPALPMLALFVVLLVIPGTFASLWGPKFISPTVSGLLFMTEIVVGAISAAILSGEPFGTREALGVTLIAGASMIEPLRDFTRSRRASV